MEKDGKIRAALLALAAVFASSCTATGGFDSRVGLDVPGAHPASALRGWMVRTRLRIELGDVEPAHSILDVTDLRTRELTREGPIRLAPAAWTCSTERVETLPSPIRPAVELPVTKYREPCGELFADPPPGGLPFCTMTTRGWQATEDSFLWSLGTGIADEELGSRWTCAAITDEDDMELPALQIWGSTYRSTDSLQFAPGFFWKPARNLMLNVTMLMDMTGDGPGWGLLVSLAR